MSPSNQPSGLSGGPSQLPLYLMGSAAWFGAFGIQTVVFTYISAQVLALSGVYFALAQASFMLPALFLLLLGGAVAEHSDTRRLMVMAHLGAVVPPLFVAWLVASGTLTFVPLILAGLFMGTVSAFMLPAREAMLARVLGTNEGAAIQRAVRFSLLAQFLAQVAGMAFARLADKTGLEVMLLIQAGLQLAGAAAAFMLLPAPSLLTNSAAGLRASGCASAKASSRSEIHPASCPSPS